MVRTSRGAATLAARAVSVAVTAAPASKARSAVRTGRMRTDYPSARGVRCRTSGHRRRTIAGVAHPSGTPSLREAQRQFTHERLIDAAQEEFAERGYVGARIDDIA